MGWPSPATPRGWSRSCSTCRRRGTPRPSSRIPGRSAGPGSWTSRPGATATPSRRPSRPPWARVSGRSSPARTASAVSGVSSSRGWSRSCGSTGSTSWPTGSWHRRRPTGCCRRWTGGRTASSTSAWRGSTSRPARRATTTGGSRPTRSTGRWSPGWPGVRATSPGPSGMTTGAWTATSSTWARPATGTSFPSRSTACRWRGITASRSCASCGRSGAGPTGEGRGWSTRPTRGAVPPTSPPCRGRHDHRGAPNPARGRR